MFPEETLLLETSSHTPEEPLPLETEGTLRKLDVELRGLSEELREHRGLSRGKELACNQGLFLALGVGILMSDHLDFNIALSLRPVFPIFSLCVGECFVDKLSLSEC